MKISVLACFVGGGGGARKLCAGDVRCELECVVDEDVTVADGRWAEGEPIGAFMLGGFPDCLGMTANRGYLAMVG